MQRLTRARTVLALALVGALALAGCGGGGDNGAEQDLREQLAMLETDLDTAEVAQATAEAAQAAAEGAQTEAEAAQATAEAERDAANIARGAADQAAENAMAAQAAAEGAQTEAEAAQATAEAAQIAAQTAQATAETDRDAAKAAQMAADAARDAAKDAEAAAKVAQAQAEAAKMTAEADSADAMVAQAAAEAAQATAEAAQAQAEAAKMTAEADSADAMVAQAAAEAAQATAEAAQAQAEAAKMTAEADSADAMVAQAAAEAAQATAEAAQAQAEAAKMTAEQRATDAEAAKKVAEDALAALQGTVDTDDVMDVTAQAKALLAVLVDNDVDDRNDSGLAMDAQDDILGPDGEVVASLQESRNDVGNLMMEVSKDGMLMAEVEDNDDYSMPPDMAPDMIDGWRGVMLTRDNADGTMDTVVAYSNIGNDGTESLLDRYVSARPTTTKPRTWSVTLILNDEPVPEENADQIPWSEVERPDTKTSFTGTDVAMLTFKGTVHDIPGTFSCEVGGLVACSDPARYSNGKVSADLTNTDSATGDWTFVPDEGVSLYTDDTTYLTFGWWLDKDAGGNPEDFLAFSTATGLGVIRDATGIGDATDGVVSLDANDAVGTEGSLIRGSATYKGAAAGKYATASTISSTYEGGHFTADATLMVDFDVELDAGATNGVALSGMIDNFMTGDTSRPDWSVKLMVDDDLIDDNPVLPVATLVGAADARMLTEWSTGGVAKGTGEWTAQWYGGVTATGDVTTITKGAPEAVIGTFDADIGNAARLQGAFGAMKTME